MPPFSSSGPFIPSMPTSPYSTSFLLEGQHTIGSSYDCSLGTGCWGILSSPGFASLSVFGNASLFGFLPLVIRGGCLRRLGCCFRPVMLVSSFSCWFSFSSSSFSTRLYRFPSFIIRSPILICSNLSLRPNFSLLSTHLYQPVGFIGQLYPLQSIT